MKAKLMLSLLLAAPMATRAMEEVAADELAQLEQGTAVVKGPLADFMQSCGVHDEEELAKRVRTRVDKIDREGHDAIIKGLTYLAIHSPKKLEQLLPLVVQTRSGEAEQPVDQLASANAAVDILQGINGALITGTNIAANWNETDNTQKIVAIGAAVTDLALLVEQSLEKSGCCGLAKPTRNKK